MVRSFRLPAAGRCKNWGGRTPSLLARNGRCGSKAVLSIEVATFRGWFSYESTAAAPLLRTTALIAAAMLSGAQIASIRYFVIAGLSLSVDAAPTYPSLPRFGSGLYPVHLRKRRALPASRCSSDRETCVLLVLSFTPFRGPFGPSADSSAYYALC
jgi:hypothetical protein